MRGNFTDVYKTIPIVDNVEQIAQDYYGWTVDASALQQSLVSKGCATSHG